MEGRWCSAAEVAADVSRAGGGVAPPVPLAGACLAWGARPGPLIPTEPSAPRAPAPAPPAPPDLRGITQMLRLVQTEDTDEDSSAPGDMVISKLGRPPAPAPPQCPQWTPRGARTHLNTICYDATADSVITSGLNPNVPEFVPRSTPPGVEPSRRAPSDGLTGSGREELAARLRDDISGGHDKCSAIARLMRLYAEPARAPSQRLLTPDYFERAAAPERGADPNLNVNSSRMTETASERIESVGSHCVSPMICDRPHEGAPHPNDVRPPEGAAHPHDVRASVDKVRRWLSDGGSEPASPRASPHLLLAPVTFRARTPASPAPTPPPKAPAAAATRAYSPPPRAAAALHREYAARAAAAQAAAPAPQRKNAAPAPLVARAADTLWSRVEASLRQKETELRARGAAEP